MLFDLKNEGETYQRLVNQMFKDKLGETIEVYIDDMVVKSTKAKDHLKDLEFTFNILDEYNMKLNPTKCHFGMTSGKFLGYMVTKRGIEAIPKKIKSYHLFKILILDKRYSETNRKSNGTSHIHLKIIRKVQGFLWYIEEEKKGLSGLKARRCFSRT